MDKKVREEHREHIIDLLINKAALKQDVAGYAEGVFDSFKAVVENEIVELKNSVDDERVRLHLEERGKNEFRLFIGSDVLVFQLHTNIFRFDDDHPIWKTKYLEDNGANGYFAIINIYNFLAESVEQSRLNDAGYLIGRMFMNHNYHFMVEGKGQLGFLFRDLENSTLTDSVIRSIVQNAMAFAIEFDLITPPYDMVQEVSIAQINEISSDLKMATGKRLGFKFGHEDSDVF